MYSSNRVTFGRKTTAWAENISEYITTRTPSYMLQSGSMSPKLKPITHVP